MSGKFEIFAMYGFALAVPTYGLSGRDTEIFLYYPTSTLEIFLSALLYLLSETSSWPS